MAVHVVSPSSADNLRRVMLIAANRSSSARTGIGLRRTRSLSRSQSAATAAYWYTTATSTGRPGTVNIRICATRSSITDMVLRILGSSTNLSGDTLGDWLPIFLRPSRARRAAAWRAAMPQSFWSAISTYGRPTQSSRKRSLGGIGGRRWSAHRATNDPVMARLWELSAELTGCDWPQRVV